METINTKPATIDQLVAVLEAPFPIYALIDPMLGEPLPGMTPAVGLTLAQARANVWQRKVHQIELDERVPLFPHQHPYLVELNGIEDPILQMTFELAEEEHAEAGADGIHGDGGAPHRLGGWLQSDTHPGQLLIHLATMFRLSVATRITAKYLRLPDRRVLGLVRDTVGETRMADLLGPIAKWVYLDAFGRVESLPGSGKPTSLRLSRDEWKLISQSEVIHRAISQCQLDGQRYSQVIDAARQMESVANVFAHRFDGTADLAKWLALTVLHPRLADTRSVTSFMSQAGDPPELVRHIYCELLTLMRSSDTLPKGDT